MLTGCNEQQLTIHVPSVPPQNLHRNRPPPQSLTELHLQLDQLLSQPLCSAKQLTADYIQESFIQPTLEPIYLVPTPLPIQQSNEHPIQLAITLPLALQQQPPTSHIIHSTFPVQPMLPLPVPSTSQPSFANPSQQLQLLQQLLDQNLQQPNAQPYFSATPQFLPIIPPSTLPHTHLQSLPSPQKQPTLSGLISAFSANTTASPQFSSPNPQVMYPQPPAKRSIDLTTTFRHRFKATLISSKKVEEWKHYCFHARCSKKRKCCTVLCLVFCLEKGGELAKLARDPMFRPLGTRTKCNCGTSLKL